MSVCTINERRSRVASIHSILDIDDSVYIYEDFFGKIVEYIVAAVICDKDGVTYSLDAFNENGDLINYRTLDQSQIGVTAYLDLESAAKAQE